MTASDVPTTTGAPDNGFEGLRFLGYPVYEGLVLWDSDVRRQTGQDQTGACRKLGAGRERQVEMDLPPAAWRQISRRQRLHRRRGNLEPRPLF
jgi:hypothetical protein